MVLGGQTHRHSNTSSPAQQLGGHRLVNWAFLVSNNRDHTAPLVNTLLGLMKYPMTSRMPETYLTYSGVHAQSCLTLWDPMDYSPPGSSVHGILQERILEQVAMSSSRGSSQPRDRSCGSRVSCISTWLLYHCATREAPDIQQVPSDYFPFFSFSIGVTLYMMLIEQNQPTQTLLITF